MGAQFSRSTTAPRSVSPFGGVPFQLTHAGRTQFTDPLSMGFGYGGGSAGFGGKGFQSPYAPGGGPTASFINQAAPLTESYLPNVTQLSSDITGGAKSAYGGYQ